MLRGFSGDTAVGLSRDSVQMDSLGILWVSLGQPRELLGTLWSWALQAGHSRDSLVMLCTLGLGSS